MSSRFFLLSVFLLGAISVVSGQTGSAAAAAAGASLAGSASQSGASASANAASAGGGASGAPVEVQIMVYGGLKQIARHIADDTSVALRAGTSTKASFSGAASINDTNRGELDTKENPWQCTETPVATVLLQDSTSSAQIALYKTFDAYYSALSASYDEVIKLLSEQKDKETEQQRQQIDQLKQQLQDMKNNVEELENKLQQQTHAKPQIKPNQFEPDIQSLTDNLAHAQEAVASMAAATAAAGGGGGGGGGGATTGGGGGGSSSQPASLQYLSGIGAEVTAAKQNMSYTSSSVQALTQALTTELGKDLCHDKIELRTASTTLNLDEAATDIAAKWKELQEKSGKLARLVAWLQKPAKDANDKDVPKPVPNSQDLIATSDGIVLGTALSNAVTAFQTWMGAGDQMGGIILTDVLKGDQLLKDASVAKLPALQVSIDAAGGNTRTNSFPLFNFFYLPRPSFNAGVVVTYELRDDKNNFLAGDTKKVIYAYSKWKAEEFCMKEEVNSVDLDTGRPSKVNSKKCRN